MRSIKIKFTLILSLTILVVISSFSFLIYISNIVNNDGPLTVEEIQGLTKFNPRLRNYIEEVSDVEDIRELSQAVRDDQTDRYTRTILLLIFPSVGISALIAYGVASYLVKPIEELTTSISFLGPKNLAQRLENRESSEEIEILIDSFNNLLDELEGSFKLQDRFIQDAAHELRTPLAAMKTNIQIFREAGSKNKLADYKKLVDLFEKLNNKLIKINENLLFINRQRRHDFEMEPVNINNLIEDIYENLEGKAIKKKIKVEFKLDKDLPKANFDREKMTYVIKNLIENAIKYTPSKGEVLIETYESDKNIKLKVKDNGIGIPDSDQDIIFERFFRASNAIDSLEEGEGLGLAIVKEVVEAHGGKVTVNSSKGEGSTFTVSLSKG